MVSEIRSMVDEALLALSGLAPAGQQLVVLLTIKRLYVDAKLVKRTPEQALSELSRRPEAWTRETIINALSGVLVTLVSESRRVAGEFNKATGTDVGILDQATLQGNVDGMIAEQERLEALATAVEKEIAHVRETLELLKPGAAAPLVAESKPLVPPPPVPGKKRFSLRDTIEKVMYGPPPATQATQDTDVESQPSAEVINWQTRPVLGAGDNDLLNLRETVLPRVEAKATDSTIKTETVLEELELAGFDRDAVQSLCVSLERKTVAQVAQSARVAEMVRNDFSRFTGQLQAIEALSEMVKSIVGFFRISRESLMAPSQQPEGTTN